MSEEQKSDENSALEMLASQLSCPEGEFGTALAVKMNESNIKITSLAVEALKPIDNDIILEIGLGNGQLSIPVIESIGEKGIFVAVEKSESMATQATQLFDLKEYKNTYVKNADFMDIEVQEESLTGIYCVNVLYFVEDLAAFLKRMHFCLKDAGRVVIAVRSPEALKAMPFTQFGFIARSADQVLSVMKEVGFVDTNYSHLVEGEITLGEHSFPVDSLIISGYK